MAMTTFKAIPSKKNIQQKDLLLGYVMSFGCIPTLIESKLGLVMQDSNHGIIVLKREDEYCLDVQMSPKNSQFFFDSMKRFVSIFGGGKVECTTNYKSIAPLENETIVEDLGNDVFDINMDDFQKFLELPFDDKGFLKSFEWNNEKETNYRDIIASIDDWFYSVIPLTQCMKYYIFKANMENFALYCLYHGANSLDDIIRDIKQYADSYRGYLATQETPICEAMNKGLKNILKLKPIKKAA